MQSQDDSEYTYQPAFNRKCTPKASQLSIHQSDIDSDLDKQHLTCPENTEIDIVEAKKNHT